MKWEDEFSRVEAFYWMGYIDNYSEKLADNDPHKEVLQELAHRLIVLAKQLPYEEGWDLTNGAYEASRNIRD